MSLRHEVSKRPTVSLPTNYVPRYARADYDPEFSLQDSAALFRWLDKTNLVWSYHRGRERTRGFNADTSYKWTEKQHEYRDIVRAYETTRRASHSSQQDCANAWAEMKFPAHKMQKSRRPAATRPWPPGEHGPKARLYSSDNFRGIQHADGSGELRHYRTTECWRTRSGLIINNVECWSRGFARCTTPGSVFRDDDDRSPDYSLSEEAVEQMARMVRNTRSRTVSDGGTPTPPEDDKYDLMSIEEVPDGHTKLDDSVEDLRIFQFYSGAAVVLLTDCTARGTGGERVAFALSPDEARTYRTGKRHWAQVVEDHLTPQEVRDSDLPVVGAHESEDDHRIPGDAIVRQGEWFFVPTNEEPQREVDAEIATDEAHLGNHKPRDFGLDYDGTRYVRGWLNHDRDHERAYIGERWHRPLEHDRENVRVFSTDETSSWTSDRRARGTRID